jgi:hypothetical protein
MLKIKISLRQRGFNVIKFFKMIGVPLSKLSCKVIIEFRDNTSTKAREIGAILEEK